MIVGKTGGGKTSNYNVLKRAMSALKEQEGFNTVKTNIINPKAITKG
jgi:dynein heavy chain